MFVDVTGSFNRLGYTVLLNHQNWGWGQAKTIDYFKAADTSVNLSAFPYTFGTLKLTQDGTTTVLSLTGSGAQGDTKSLRLLNTKISDITAANFFGLKGGSFSDVTIDDPSNAVYFTVSTSVSGSGGTVSPSGAVQVRQNTNQLFTLTPAAGYKVKSIVLNGVAQPVGNSITVNQVNANATLVVSFEPGSSCLTPAWDTNAVYVGGNKVSYQGFEYTARWWTQGNAPGSNEVWTKGAACQ